MFLKLNPGSSDAAQARVFGRAKAWFTRVKQAQAQTQAQTQAQVQAMFTRVKVMLHETIFNDDFSRRFLMHVTRDNF